MLVVTDPSKMGFETAKRVKELIEEVHIGVKKTYLVGNRFPPQLLDVLEKAADDIGLELAGSIPEDSNVQSFNMTGKPLLDVPDDSPSYRAIEEIAKKIGLKNLV
jgi:CO dehydrogenase maturation factor